MPQTNRKTTTEKRSKTRAKQEQKKPVIFFIGVGILTFLTHCPIVFYELLPEYSNISNTLYSEFSEALPRNNIIGVFRGLKKRTAKQLQLFFIGHSGHDMQP